MRACSFTGPCSCTTAPDGCAASRRVPSQPSTAGSASACCRSGTRRRPLSSRRSRSRSASRPGTSCGPAGRSRHVAPPGSACCGPSDSGGRPRRRRASKRRSSGCTTSSPSIATGSVTSRRTARRRAAFPSSSSRSRRIPSFGRAGRRGGRTAPRGR